MSDRLKEREKCGLTALGGLDNDSGDWAGRSDASVPILPTSPYSSRRHHPTWATQQLSPAIVMRACPSSRLHPTPPVATSRQGQRSSFHRPSKPHTPLRQALCQRVGLGQLLDRRGVLLRLVEAARDDLRAGEWRPNTARCECGQLALSSPRVLAPLPLHEGSDQSRRTQSVSHPLRRPSVI